MDTDTIVGWGLIGVVVLAMFIAFVIEPSDPIAAEGWYGFAGMFYVIFGIWGGIKLLNR